MLAKLRICLYMALLISGVAVASEATVKRELQKKYPEARVESVAKTRFPKLAKGQTPWDAGYLHLNEISEAWRDGISKLKKGEVSGVIKGYKDSAHILMLVDSRIDPGVNFENQKETIKNVLRYKKLTELTETTDNELRKKAKIVYQDK